MQCEINYVGLQLEAGDIVTITNANYGWVAKLFRIMKVTEKISELGQVTAALSLSEYNPAVYDDKNITEFQPIPNTGIPSPTTFGTVPAPVVSTSYPAIANPSFSITVTTSSAGIIQYAEIWYSAYQYPTQSQYIFAGTTAVNPNGDPYNNSEALTPIQLFDIPAGDWYFFTRMVNSIASSNYSLASAKLIWRPQTFQYTEKYLAVAYADNITGTSNFSLTPTNKLYYGLYNTSATTAPTNSALYNWYLADPAFGTTIYLAYANRQSRRFSFDTSVAGYAAGTAAFIPSNAISFPPTIWSALPSTSNIIDLDLPTGQVISTGSTGQNTNDGILTVTNTSDGRVIASLDPFLADYVGSGGTLTVSAGTITIDKFGRVVGVTPPDDFFLTIESFTATSGQTVFTPTSRNAAYITGQDLIFQNGLLLSTSDYTESSTTFTLNVGAITGDILTCLSMRAKASSITFINTGLTVSSVASATVTWSLPNLPHQLINAGDKMTFLNTGTPTQYTVSSVNYSTRQITFTTTVTSVSAGAIIYNYRALNASYPVFSRFEDDLTATSDYTPTTWSFQSGYELTFLNGTAVNEQDYDIVGNSFTNLPSTTTGKLVIIQLSQNNLNTPSGSPQNLVAFTVNGQLTYSFAFVASALNVYANGVLFKNGTDYTEGTNNYTLATAITNITTILLQQTFARAGAA